MRDWLRVLRLVWQFRRANRRYVLRYARYGPGCGTDAQEIRDLYRGISEALVRAAMDGRRPRTNASSGNLG